MPLKVSIVIPAKNVADTLSDCIDSIILQDLNEFEILVVDDGSTDQTAAICKRYAYQDSRIKYARLSRDPCKASKDSQNQYKGIVAALNFGLSLARSEYVARMDADDIMLPHRLSAQYHYLINHPDISLVASQAELFPVDEIKSGYREYMRWQNACLSHDDICNNIYLESPLVHPSVMFKKSMIQSLGGYRHGQFPEDYDLWLRMYRHGCRFHKMASVQLKWRESRDRTSRVDPRYSREAFDELRAKYLVGDSRLSGSRPIVVWGVGRKTRQRVAHIISRGAQVSLWIDIDPKKIGNKINGAWVKSPEALSPLNSKLNNIKGYSADKKPFVLCYVNNHGARQKIADQLHDYQYVCGSDYLMVG